MSWVRAMTVYTVSWVRTMTVYTVTSVVSVCSDLGSPRVYIVTKVVPYSVYSNLISESIPRLECVQ